MAKPLPRYRWSDATSDWRPFGGRAGGAGFADQGSEAEEPEGELICRVMQTGADTWAGHDGKGRSLRIKRGRDGALEIRHMAETGADDEADPDIVGTAPGLSDPDRATVDPARLSGRAGDALSRYQRHPTNERHIPGLAALQKRLNAFYADK